MTAPSGGVRSQPPAAARRPRSDLIVDMYEAAIRSGELTTAEQLQAERALDERVGW